MRPDGDGLIMADLARRLSAEALGTQALLAAVVGSGIMGERLSGGNDAIALLANAVATGAALVVLITILSPVSGAHFNPAVTLAAALRREISWAMAGAYALAQTAGAVGGVMMAHAMFELPIVAIATQTRDGVGQAVSEMIATFGLVAAILGCARWRPEATPVMVGLYVTAGYWFTASTGFANPAVTLARSLTDTFTGIAPASVPLFIAAQIAGAVAAVGVAGWLFGASDKPD